jgi:putative mRNA 3-end processing factor
MRLGENNYQAAEWEEKLFIDGVRVSLHPAGHMIGSSQVRVEHNGEVWVVSGDYKIEDDGLSGKFEPIKCDTFITESTFGLPIYNWKPQQEIFQNILDWISKNKERGKTSVLTAYSLGKSQRLMQCLPEAGLPIYVHGAIWNAHETLKRSGVQLPDVERINYDTPKDNYLGNIVVAPSGAEASPWIKRFFPYAVGICSGWMQVRGTVRRQNADAGFALSDHADWNGLLWAVKETGAKKVFVTHGYQSVLSRYLNEIGIEAAEVKTEFGNEVEEKNSIIVEGQDSANEK